MKMAKADAKDVAAAAEALAVLNDIAGGYFPDSSDDTPTLFNEDDPKHLRLFYDKLKKTLDDAPGWQGRVIAGMCFVILYDKNQIVDPDADTLELHPRLESALRDAAAKRQPLSESIATQMAMAIDLVPYPTTEDLIDLIRGVERAHGIEAAVKREDDHA